ncbi:hypothetical protein SNOG_07600 [Parastagonospora nodorum SN15]|uniref:Uncharacterized protein n=1 Tax=Phaeosphaeria nodorum (strain SN15 / ATCC MYA-4574 / FGSC 10173) TaxID=321614 RepID=Q0UKW4_PHANO|nr:hypothetical protein SNOG_07600 [Parastagonospora nodorum SN15]EAT85066.1 hypothetical protein SNOG_07600 [Parastagonospora nodorum SN15]
MDRYSLHAANSDASPFSDCKGPHFVLGTLSYGLEPV